MSVQSMAIAVLLVSFLVMNSAAFPDCICSSVIFPSVPVIAGTSADNDLSADGKGNQFL